MSNFDKVLIINLGLACSNNGDQDVVVAVIVAVSDAVAANAFS